MTGTEDIFSSYRCRYGIQTLLLLCHFLALPIAAPSFNFVSYNIRVDNIVNLPSGFKKYKRVEAEIERQLAESI